MEKNIRTTITKENSGISLDKIISIDLLEKNNVGDLINEIKSKLWHLKNLNIKQEKLYFGTQLMKLEESVPCETGIKLIITVE